MVLQMLPGSRYLEVIREKLPIPSEDVIYIYGKKDTLVSKDSACPLGEGVEVSATHDLFPQKEELLADSAIPVVVEIVKKTLASL